VLTSEFVHGKGLSWATEQEPELRQSYAATLWRFVFRANLLGGRFNADPHPGNFLFHPDGTVTFLDFGCVQPLSENLLRSARTTHLAALARDEQAFAHGVTSMMGLRGGRFGEASIKYVRRCFEPLFNSPYHMRRDWVTALVRETQEFKKEVFARDGSLVPMPPELALLNRLQFGFYSVLARFDVAVDYAAVERTFLEDAPAERSTAHESGRA
jgi:predicted unusual protein kinase regulating ubiquinone biosynthesis (AarF/ABC1/UbiB family)